MDKRLLLQTAVASVLALSATLASTAALADEAKEKCFGVSKAGKNDCATKGGTHSCAGQTKADNDPADWKFVAKGSCEKMGGGMTMEDAQKMQMMKKG